MNKALPAIVPSVVIAVLLAVLIGAGYRAVNGSPVKRSHEGAITRANCIGRCHTETQIAALLAAKNGIKTHGKWAHEDSSAQAKAQHSTNPEVVAILNSYFPPDPPKR